jgi:hypothetical protein
VTAAIAAYARVFALPEQVVTASAEGPVADHVAQRVDAPRHVLEYGDAYETGPQQSGRRVVRGAADGPPGGER